MNRDWWTILRFAILGLAMAIWVIGAALLLCPGLIPFAWAASIEMQMPSFSRIMVDCWGDQSSVLCGYRSGLRPISELASRNG
jgi:hypothetical protein